MDKIVIVRIGKTNRNYSAMIEGLDGFVCTAPSLQELKKEVADGIAFHLEGLKEEGIQSLKYLTMILRSFINGVLRAFYFIIREFCLFRRLNELPESVRHNWGTMLLVVLFPENSR